MLSYFDNLTTRHSDRTQILFDPRTHTDLINQRYTGTAADYLSSFDDSIQQATRGFAYLELHTLVKDYLVLLSKPTRVDFMSGQVTDCNKKDKLALEHEFWRRAADFVTQKKICTNCDKYIEDGQTECAECCTLTGAFSVSYMDVTRTNYSSKYSYFRKQHFYDCMIQFQGKQPAHLSQELMERLTRLYLHNKKYMTKFNIMKWLKDMNETSHYEDIHLIYSLLLGEPAPNLDAIEQQLLADFDLFLTEYTKIINKHDQKVRKNFINIQYVLFQLLKRHGFPCKAADFILPRTLEIRKTYDAICAEIFAQLKWNHTAIS